VENWQIFFTNPGDNGSMSNKNQRSIRFEPWVREAIEELAAEHQIDFSKEVENLLIVELSYLGHTEAVWLAKTYGIGRETVKMPLEGERPPEVGEAR
jgi:hypothetical protein